MMKTNSLTMSVDDQNTQTITLATNDDFLKMLNPEELKIQGSSETHLPILAELVQYFGSQKVLDWMGDGSKHSNEKLVHEASNYVLPTTCGDGKMHFKAAVDYLKRTYKKVNDVRSDVEMYLKMPKPDTVEPTKEDGWTFLSKNGRLQASTAGLFSSQKSLQREKQGCPNAQNGDRDGTDGRWEDRGTAPVCQGKVERWQYPFRAVPGPKNIAGGPSRPSVQRHHIGQKNPQAPAHIYNGVPQQC